MGEKKVKLRMGMHNRITRDRFQAIKDDLNNGLLVQKVAKRHSVSDATVRKVRRSRNFNEYRIDAEALKNRRNQIVVVAPKSGLPFEDFGARPIFSSKMFKPKGPTMNDRLDREAEKSAKTFGIVALGIVGLIVLGLSLVALIVGVAK